MSSRRLEILRAIVDEYVATQEPVGSKSIAERHGLGISPATIRNEMAVLEDEGLIIQPPHQRWANSDRFRVSSICRQACNG